MFQKEAGRQRSHTVYHHFCEMSEKGKSVQTKASLTFHVVTGPELPEDRAVPLLGLGCIPLFILGATACNHGAPGPCQGL